MKILKNGEVVENIKNKKTIEEIKSASNTRNKIDGIFIYKDELVEILSPVTLDYMNDIKTELILRHERNSVAFIYNNEEYIAVELTVGKAFIDFITYVLELKTEAELQSFLTKNSALLTETFNFLECYEEVYEDNTYTNREFVRILTCVFVENIKVADLREWD